MAAFSECPIDEAVSEAGTKMGYSRLTTRQGEVVKAFVKGQYVFFSLPTSGRVSGTAFCP